MAAPITPISEKPFDAFSVSLPAATVVVLDPQPFNNTKEVVFLNRSTTDAMLVSIERLVASPAQTVITPDPTSGQLPPQDRTAGGRGAAWGGGGADTLTIDGNVLTATGGPRTAGTDTFSVDVRAQATLTLNAGLNVGDTITFSFGDGLNARSYVLEAVAGPRVAGTLTFDVAVGGPAQAAAINTAINDSAISDDTPPILPNNPGLGNVATSTVALNVITLTAGNKASLRGANGNAPQRNRNVGPVGQGVPLSPTGYQSQVGLSLSSSSADVVVAEFTGGVNADGGVTRPPTQREQLVLDPATGQTRPVLVSAEGGIVSNRIADYAVNIAVGLNDAPAFAATLSQAAAVLNDPTGGLEQQRGTVSAQMAAVGAAGNGLVCSENTAAARLSITTPTAGGVNAVPAALAAATSTVIPAGSAITLAVGSTGNRQELATDTYWGANSGSGLGIVAQMEAGGPADLNVTYVNNRGYPEGV